MKEEYISVYGARENNLKNIDVKIPRDKLVVLTGLSGSGKSSLAFETIYAEGQRRYMESLSSYARMFIGQMEKPDVDKIEGLSPAISIDQKTTSKNPRSTVGTVTEIYDYLRLLYARTGDPHCPKCGKPIYTQTIDQMTDRIMALPEGSKVQLMAPVVRGRKGEYTKLLETLRKKGYSRVRVDGDIYPLEEDIKLDRYKIHHIDVVIDRLVIREGLQSRINDSLEVVLALAAGIAIANVAEPENSAGEKKAAYDIMFSSNYACPDCGVSLPEVSPKLFSFNSPMGACPKCAGIGRIQQFEKNFFASRIGHRTFYDLGMAMLFEFTIAQRMEIIEKVSKKYDFDMHLEFKEYPPEIKDIIMCGDGEYAGLIASLEKRYQRKMDGHIEMYPLEYYMTESICSHCHGMRLNENALSFTVGGKNIAEFTEMSVDDALVFVENLKLSHEKTIIAESIIKELKGRLGFLKNVGLGYLTLSRSSGTLSGGESQRIRLATQIGAGLMGVLYILDEPSIGLHQRDNDKLLSALKGLRDLGNTLIVVEHDEDTMRQADYIIDIGPAAGVHGGELIAAGTPEEIMNCEESITGQYLKGTKKIKVPLKRRKGNGLKLTVKGGKINNLRDVNVDFPLGKFICVTGVSGSGKSSLINQVLCKGLEENYCTDGSYDEIEGKENIDKLVCIDQSPIGRTPRSNPATYVGVFTAIRDLFALVPESRARGYKSGRFSFNTKGGRCEACDGDGIKKIEMHFLPDVYVPCEVCKGKRYNRETLEIKYKGKNISDVLDMTVDDAVEFFKDIPSVQRKIKTLEEVGLGYIKLGQPSTTLSGGEAQRVKLATELSKVSTGKTFYVLDEPTTGLHTDDVRKLIEILQKLVESGNTVVVIEHNLELIKCADYIIDMGPEGGDGGGNVVFTGMPEEIIKCEKSYTGHYLKGLLK